MKIIVFLMALLFSSYVTATQPQSIGVPTAALNNPGFPPPDKDFSDINQQINSLGLDFNQFYVLQLARVIGKKYGLGETLMGIVWQESRAGKLGPIGDIQLGFGYRSYGICQMKLRTARAVLKKYPELGRYPTDEELIAALITNKQFNLNMAAHRLLMLKNKGLSWSQIVSIYNVGHPIKNPSKWEYTSEVRKHMHTNPIVGVIKIDGEEEN